MPPLTDEQLAQRKFTLGSSEVAAVLGLNEWCSPHQVWLSKMGLADFTGNDATEAGNDFEPVILARAARHNNIDLRPGTTVPGPESWMSATPDSFIVPRGLVECKFVGFNQAWAWGSEIDGVPYNHLCQVHWQLACTSEPFCIVAAQMGTRHKYYRIEADAEFAKLVVNRCRTWWQRYVETGEPPPVDGSKGATEMLRKLYPRSEKAFRTSTPEEEELASRIIEARAAAKQTEDVAAELENLMRQSVEDWERVVGNGWRVRYKTQKDNKRPFYFEPEKKAGLAA